MLRQVLLGSSIPSESERRRGHKGRYPILTVYNKKNGEGLLQVSATARAARCSSGNAGTAVLTRHTHRNRRNSRSHRTRIRRHRGRNLSHLLNCPFHSHLHDAGKYSNACDQSTQNRCEDESSNDCSDIRDNTTWVRKHSKKSTANYC